MFEGKSIQCNGYFQMEKLLAKGDDGLNTRKCSVAKSVWIRLGIAFDNNVLASTLDLVWKYASPLFRNQDIFFHSYNSARK